MAQQRATIRPTGGKKLLTVRVRVTARAVPAGANVDVADTLLQAGSTVTGWVPHVTELPWTSGVTSGGTQ